MQHILCYAIKYVDGEKHCQQPLNVKQGFVTNDDMFVDSK